MSCLPVPVGRGRTLPPDLLPAVVAILNVTPDSFSDGGRLRSVDDAVRLARGHRDAGAAILDVGGESTRPGAEDVPVDEELRRVVPVVRALVERVGLPVSIDTRKAAVFREAHAAGASLLNDVSALAHDPGMAAAAAASDAAVVLMHGRGDPRSMDALARYGDPVLEVRAELETAVARAEAAGIGRDRLIVDPGLGFAKTAAHSWALVRGIEAARPPGLPLMAGPSRKRFLGEATGRRDPLERDLATAVVAGWLALRGVELLRVHAVGPARDAISVAARLAEPAAAGAIR